MSGAGAFWAIAAVAPARATAAVSKIVDFLMTTLLLKVGINSPLRRLTE
jgi:hypothetical protein